MSRVRDGRSVPRMALQPSSPTLRESVDELSQRLARIGADPVPDDGDRAQVDPRVLSQVQQRDRVV